MAHRLACYWAACHRRRMSGRRAASSTLRGPPPHLPLSPCPQTPERAGRQRPCPPPAMPPCRPHACAPGPWPPPGQVLLHPMCFLCERSWGECRLCLWFRPQKMLVQVPRGVPGIPRSSGNPPRHQTGHCLIVIAGEQPGPESMAKPFLPHLQPHPVSPRWLGGWAVQ